MSREAWALFLVLAYSALCAAVLLRARRRQATALAQAAALLPAAGSTAPLLVLHASQTGSSEEIAWATAQALHLAGLPVRVLALGEAALADLQAATHALFITSTYGEGDAPDNGARFAQEVMAAPASLAPLHVGVLALGDSTYAHFCGFGRLLDGWLRASGARPLFERIEVDRGDERAIALWRQHLSHLAGTAEMLDWQDRGAFAPWQLLERRRLNPGSQGGPVFHLEFAPADGAPLPGWEAGDLVQLEIPGEAPREYTIASLPADGRVHLMVRQSRRADGSVGLASGLLTEGLVLGEATSLRVRTHRNFRIGANAARPLILIGNGTGLAGLRAHLKALAARGAAKAWLLYGERQVAHDAHYAGEIEAWRESGLLARVDRSYSRDGSAQRYVQQALSDAREALLEWVAQGAAIYVCGSLQGMAGGVDAVLREVLGDAQIDALIAQARYQRDVY